MVRTPTSRRASKLLSGRRHNPSNVFVPGLNISVTKCKGTMSLQSKIEWTEATWNPIRGCQKISPGCKHCYAETFAERFRNVPGHPYEHGFTPRLVPEKLVEPFRWGTRKTVFVNSMSDLFQDTVPD